MNLEFIIPPEMFSLVLQFRDSLGNNYLYQSWLFTDTAKEERRNLKLGSFEAKFKPAKRIEYNPSSIFDSIKQLRLVFTATNHIIFPMRFLRLIPMLLEIFTTKIKMHLYLEKDIRNILLRSFSAGFQDLTEHVFIEGRGSFSEL